MRYLGLNIFKLLRYLKEELLLIVGTSTAEPALPGLMRKLEFAGVRKEHRRAGRPHRLQLQPRRCRHLPVAGRRVPRPGHRHPPVDGPADRPHGRHAADLQGRRRSRRRRVHRAGRHPEHRRQHPARRHHADLRHRQVHVRVPRPGQLLRQRRRHAVRRQVGPDPRRRPGPARAEPRAGPALPPSSTRHQPARAARSRAPEPHHRRRVRPAPLHHEHQTTRSADRSDDAGPHGTEADTRPREGPRRTRQVQGQPHRCPGRPPPGSGPEQRGIHYDGLPLADGGDGSVAAAVAAGFQPVRSPWPPPPGNATRPRSPSTASPPSSRSPTPAGCTPCPRARWPRCGRPAAGLGHAVRAALQLGANRIVLALGGSASTDGGAGMLAALGAVFRDRRAAGDDRRRHTRPDPHRGPRRRARPGRPRSSSPVTCRTR